MKLLGYRREQRAAFWSFAHANGLPLVRSGQRKIQFCEAAVIDWLARRSTSALPGGACGKEPPAITHGVATAPQLTTSPTIVGDDSVVRLVSLTHREVSR